MEANDSLPLENVKENLEGKEDKKGRKEQRQLFEDSQLKSYNQDVEERKKFAKWIFWLVVGWLVAVLGIIVCSSIKSGQDAEGGWLYILETSDAVLLGLLGATTINVLGLFVIVAKYLFSDKLPPKLIAEIEAGNK